MLYVIRSFLPINVQIYLSSFLYLGHLEWFIRHSKKVKYQVIWTSQDSIDTFSYMIYLSVFGLFWVPDLKNLLYSATIGVSKYLIGIFITEIRFYICSLYTRPSAEYRSVYISHVLVHQLGPYPRPYHGKGHKAHLWQIVINANNTLNVYSSIYSPKMYRVQTRSWPVLSRGTSSLLLL